MTLPNFLVVGAAKSGTTAIYHYLKQHPQVYMGPTKETNFFAFEGQEVHFNGPGDEKISETAITDLDAYKKQFANVSGEIAIGEASPWYLYSDRSAENIHRHIPDAKLITVLRNPAKRAFSSYLHVARDGRERLTFEEGLFAEEERIEQGWEFIWHYRRTGYYAAQIQRLLDTFPPEQVRVYLYDDLLAQPMDFLRDVYVFLGVDPDFVVDTSLRPNATGLPRNRLLGKLLLRPNPLRSTIKSLLPRELRYNLGQRLNQRLIKKPRPSRETYGKLLDGYRDDIRDLQKLVGRDLSVWTAK